MLDMPLVLLDTRGLLLRRWYGTKEGDLLKNEEGKAIAYWGAGLDSFIRQDLTQILGGGVAPQQIIACWDGGNDYRRSLFPAYKKARREAKVDKVAREQQDLLIKNAGELFACLGCLNVMVRGQEADDLIALFCEKFQERKIDIHTVDADLLQLVGPNHTVHLASVGYMPGALYKNEIPLGCLGLYKSLVGDASDGYSGVGQFGHKAFMQILAEYGEDGMKQLEDIVAGGDWHPLEQIVNACDSKPLMKILEHWSDWVRSYNLAKLHPEVCYGRGQKGVTRPEWKARVPNSERVDTILKAAKCSHTRLLLEPYFPQYHAVTADLNAEKMADWGEEILSSPVVSYDFETYDSLCHEAFQKASKSNNYVDVLSQVPTGVSINFGRFMEKTIYLSFDHKDTANLGLEWLRWVLAVLDAREGPTVAQNANFELAVAQVNGMESRKTPYDTAVMSSYVDENESARLKDMSKKWLNYKQATYQETVGEGTMRDLTVDEVLSYGCDDSQVTSVLFHLFSMIMQLEGSWGFYVANEIEPTSDDVHMFVTGSPLDMEALKELENEDKGKADLALRDMRQLLLENVDNEDEEAITKAASFLLDEWWKTETQKFGPGDDDARDSRYGALWQDAWGLCQYREFTSSLKPEEFIGTPTKINKVLACLGYEGEPLHKSTKSGIFSWLSENEEKFATIEMKQFVAALSACAHDLAASKRNSMEYAELKRQGEEHFAANRVGDEITTGDELNFNSNKQMAGLLYGKLRLPLRRRSKVQRGSTRDRLGLPGGPATGLKAIAAAFVYDVPDHNSWQGRGLKDYYDISKSLQNASLYYDPYPLWVHPKTGRIHPQIRNCGTVTRRPTGTAPNALQVSKQEGARIRRLYPAPQGYVCLAADFANQELVILGCESKDPVMLDAFSHDPRKDLHSLTASGFAHILLPRLGHPQLSHPVDYASFLALRQDEGTREAANEIRNKYSKACIAEGSLVLTQRGLVPIEAVRLSDTLWDGIEWVSHEGVICKGIRDVIEYQGLVATPDHEVFTTDGTKLQLSVLSSQQTGPEIAIGEVEGSPVRYLGDLAPSVLEKVGGACKDQVLNMRERNYLPGSESSEGQDSGVPVSPKTLLGEKGPEAGGTVHGYGPEVLEPELSVLQELRGEGDREPIHVEKAVRAMGIGEPAARDVSGGSNRQGRQRWALRTGEPALGGSSDELVQHTANKVGGVPRDESGLTPPMAPDQALPPGVSLPPRNSTEEAEGRGQPGRGGAVPKKGRRREKVYDIVNAGPRHRFTVSGKVVANCNFLIAYLGGYTTLAENLLIAEELAKKLMEGTFALYNRVKPWQNEVIELARSQGYIETAYGNRRHLNDDLYSQDASVRKRMERQAVNYVIQGGAADLLKTVRQEMVSRQMRQRYKLEGVIPVYDEIRANVPIEAAAEYAEELVEVMSVTPPGYPVGMKVDLSVGPSWGETEEVDNVAGIKEYLDKLTSKAA